MPDMNHGYGLPGPQERLASLRSSKVEGPQGQRTQRAVRIEVLIGVIVVVVGIAVALNVLTSRREIIQQIQGTLTSEPVSTPSEDGQLLDGEGLIALAVDDGDYPPELQAGDAVRVVLTPGADGQGGFRELGEILTVQSVERQSETTDKTVVTVLGPPETAIGIAASGPIHLTIVDRSGTR